MYIVDWGDNNTEWAEYGDSGEEISLKHTLIQLSCLIQQRILMRRLLLNYQKKIMNRCGLVDYGCCEPYTRKFDMLEKIPNLRRVSVSPWCDLETAAERIGAEYIYSWKPNPAMLVGKFNENAIRKTIRRTLDIAKDCYLEIILKDTFTVEHRPERIDRWAEIVREEIEKTR